MDISGLLNHHDGGHDAPHGSNRFCGGHDQYLDVPHQHVAARGRPSGMIVLATNIVSELMRAQPAPEVVAWLGRVPESDLFTTAVTVAEIRYGIARLPDGRR